MREHDIFFIRSAEKLIIPDCFDGVVRGVEEEGGRDGVDGTAAVHVPSGVREVAGNDLEEELGFVAGDRRGGVDVGEGDGGGHVGGFEAVDEAVGPRVEAVLVPTMSIKVQIEKTVVLFLYQPWCVAEYFARGHIHL